MNITVYTLTRDRLELTSTCLSSLHAKAGRPFKHIVLDNGSEDGTQDWLVNSRDRFESLFLLKENIGIARACNLLKAHILGAKPGLIIKMDNDCEVVSDGILASIASLYGQLVPPFPVLSPHVSGIRTLVPRSHHTEVGGFRIGWTQIVGGLFHIVPVAVYQEYTYDESLPKARGNDGHFCKWLRDRGISIGYIEDLHVNHYQTTDGQERLFPEYFKRKKIEEKLK